MEEQSPYKNKTTIGDLTGYSAGLGYNFGSTSRFIVFVCQKKFTTRILVKSLDGASIDAIKQHGLTLTI
jgi:hypothetical protein